MKKSYLSLLATAAFALSACSNSPSDSAVKDAVVGALGINNCKNIVLENFQKVNGVAGKDSRSYEVDVKYTFKVLPLPNAQTIQKNFEIRHSNEDIELQKVKQDAAEKLKNFSGSNGERAIFSITLDQEIEKAKYKVSQRKSFDNEIIAKEYETGCPSASAAVKNYINQRFYEKEDWFVGGVSSDVSETVSLIKSDNGWMQAR